MVTKNTQQRVDVPGLGVTDVDEWSNRSKIMDNLIVSRPCLEFVVQSLLERVDFAFG